MTGVDMRESMIEQAREGALSSGVLSLYCDNAHFDGNDRVMSLPVLRTPATWEGGQRWP